MWREKVDSKIIAEEMPFLKRALRIGQIGCVLSFIAAIASFSLRVWYFGAVFSNFSFNPNLFSYLTHVMDLFSVAASILLAVGYYSLLRSNQSRLALPYVFLSLINYSINWTFLYSNDGGYFFLYQILDSATRILFVLALIWILWTINGTISDRELLRLIILLTIVSAVYNYVIPNLIVYFVHITTLLDYIIYRGLNITINLIQIILVAHLFGQVQVIIIDNEVNHVSSTERI